MPLPSQKCLVWKVTSVVTLSVADRLLLDIHGLLQLTKLIQNYNHSFDDHLLMTIFSAWFTRECVVLEEHLCCRRGKQSALEHQGGLVSRCPYVPLAMRSVYGQERVYKGPDTGIVEIPNFKAHLPV